MENDLLRFHTALTLLQAHISRNGMCREYMKNNSKLAIEYADIFLKELGANNTNSNTSSDILKPLRRD